MRESTLKKFLSIPHFDEHLTMHLADCLGSHGIRKIYDFLKDKLDKLDDTDLRPARLLTGHDLIQLGYKPGPHFSEILNAITEQQLEGLLKNKDDAVIFVKNTFNP